LATRLGAGGIGLSQGQKQRILIARLIYKDPEIILLDESTNSLDEINEKAIVESLDRLFRGRTIIVVAHKLNTVKNAHNVVVMHEGAIIEQGAHHELARKNGKYYTLMKDQLIAEI
jgi:ATP-binding cassette subfamily B protein